MVGQVGLRIRGVGWVLALTGASMACEGPMKLPEDPADPAAGLIRMTMMTPRPQAPTPPLVKPGSAPPPGEGDGVPPGPTPGPALDPARPGEPTPPAGKVPEPTQPPAMVDLKRPGAPDPSGAERVFAFTSTLVSEPCSFGKDGAAGIELPAPYQAHIDTLFAGHATIERNLTPLSTGIRSDNQSTDPAVAAALQAHVVEMKQWLASVTGDDVEDPLFTQLAAAAPHLFLSYQKVERGMLVELMGNTEDAVALIHAHAQLVDRFISSGKAEATRCHRYTDEDKAQDPAVLKRQERERGTAPESVDKPAP